MGLGEKFTLYFESSFKPLTVMSLVSIVTHGVKMLISGDDGDLYTFSVCSNLLHAAFQQDPEAFIASRFSFVRWKSVQSGKSTMSGEDKASEEESVAHGYHEPQQRDCQPTLIISLGFAF